MQFFRSLSWAVVLQLAAIVTAADTNAWKSRSIYFALTDRIARSSNDRGGGSCGNLGEYCGGTFKGLESKLDYIKGMGFDAIWITPVVANSDGGYHGYWASDLYAVNPKYGTADDLKSLVKSAHSKGMYVMVDAVANHMGHAALSDRRPEPLNQASSYHTACEINYNDQNSIETCSIGGLPDINTRDSNIRSVLQSWIHWLVQEYSFDGVRIDTVKHVEKDFWPGFVSAAGVYCIGEVFDGNVDYLAGYANTMPGLLNYATYYPMNDFFQQKGSSQALVDSFNAVSSKFPDPAALGTFLDNHDNPRWLNAKGDHVLLRNALAYVILSRGIPIVYYGTEQAYGGGNDPQNREDLWRSSFNTNSDMYQALTKLLNARKSAGGLAGNDHVHLYVTGNAYAFSRADGRLVVLTTNAGSGNSQQHCFNARRANTQYTNVYGSGTASTDGNGNICVTVNNGEPIVLLAGTSSRVRRSTLTM
ncbi:glycoside hydrolase family 13 protein [Periconia macrospinosa]|uniref:Alpha-amylase n=1 Tax=Periconia macrospinosa TaxID=97972 RepID=A0A2V1E2A0_9PLEO|nr:glycoside hydrolase family 13 protein [Periconia macrospinosa]